MSDRTPQRPQAQARGGKGSQSSRVGFYSTIGTVTAFFAGVFLGIHLTKSWLLFSLTVTAASILCLAFSLRIYQKNHHKRRWVYNSWFAANLIIGSAGCFVLWKVEVSELPKSAPAPPPRFSLQSQSAGVVGSGRSPFLWLRYGPMDTNHPPKMGLAVEQIYEIYFLRFNNLSGTPINIDSFSFEMGVANDWIPLRTINATEGSVFIQTDAHRFSRIHYETNNFTGALSATIQPFSTASGWAFFTEKGIGHCRLHIRDMDSRDFFVEASGFTNQSLSVPLHLPSLAFDPATNDLTTYPMFIYKK
jgi:hypothetical protein